MHLGDRSRSQRFQFKRPEQFGNRLFQRFFNNSLGFGAGEGGHLILQQSQFIGDIRCNQVASC